MVEGMRSLGGSLELVLVSAACSEPAPLPLDADRAFRVGPCSQNSKARVYRPCGFRAGGDTDGDGRGDYLLDPVDVDALFDPDKTVARRLYGAKGNLLHEISPTTIGSSELEIASVSTGTKIVADADGDGLYDIYAYVLVDGPPPRLPARLLLSGADLRVLHTFPTGTPISVGPDATGDGLVDVLVGPLQDGPTPGDLLLTTGLGEEVRRWSTDDGLLEGATSGRLIGDIDGDGLADIAITRTDGRITLHSSVDAAPLGGIAEDLRPVQFMGDTDGDGAADFLAQDKDDGYRIRTYSGRTQELLLDSNAGDFGGYGHQNIHVGPDADGDGAADILTWGEERDLDTAEVIGTVATLWSGAIGEAIARWSHFRSEPGGITLWLPDVGPDVNGDGLADVTFLAQEIPAWPEGPLEYSLYVYYSSSFLGPTFE